ncbi:MAG: hypothetical protein ACI8RZ_008083 [Myxococcota bacterium]|jgi:hypothetical protein
METNVHTIFGTKNTKKEALGPLAEGSAFIAILS